MLRAARKLIERREIGTGEAFARVAFAMLAPFALVTGSFFLVEPLGRLWGGRLGWATQLLAAACGLIPVLPLFRTSWARVLYFLIFLIVLLVGWFFITATVGCSITRTACL